MVDPPTDWKYKLTFCSGPLYGDLSPRRTWEWFSYHRVVAGMDSAVLYNVGGVTEEMRMALKEYYDNGMIDEVDFLDAKSYNVYLYNQVPTRWRRFWCREVWLWDFKGRVLGFGMKIFEDF